MPQNKKSVSVKTSGKHPSPAPQQMDRDTIVRALLEANNLEPIALFNSEGDTAALAWPKNRSGKAADELYTIEGSSVLQVNVREALEFFGRWFYLAHTTMHDLLGEWLAHVATTMPGPERLSAAALGIDSKALERAAKHAGVTPEAFVAYWAKVGAQHCDPESLDLDKDTVKAVRDNTRSDPAPPGGAGSPLERWLHLGAQLLDGGEMVTSVTLRLNFDDWCAILRGMHQKSLTLDELISSVVRSTDFEVLEGDSARCELDAGAAA